MLLKKWFGSYSTFMETFTYVYCISKMEMLTSALLVTVGTDTVPSTKSINCLI